MTGRILLAAAFALGCVARVIAGETVTGHDTHEKRSMKVETIPPAQTTERTTTEETTTGRVDRPRDTIVEERKTVEPGTVVHERKTEKTETDE